MTQAFLGSFQDLENLQANCFLPTDINHILILCTTYKGQCYNAQYGNQFQNRIWRALQETVPVYFSLKMALNTYSCNAFMYKD